MRPDSGHSATLSGGLSSASTDGLGAASLAERRAWLEYGVVTDDPETGAAEGNCLCGPSIHCVYGFSRIVASMLASNG